MGADLTSRGLLSAQRPPSLRTKWISGPFQCLVAIHPPSGSFLFLTWPSVDLGSFPPFQSPEGPWNVVIFALPSLRIKHVVALVSLFHCFQAAQLASLLCRNMRDDCPLGVREAFWMISGEWLSESMDTSHQDTLPRQSSTNHSAKYSFFSFLPAVLWKTGEERGTNGKRRILVKCTESKR